MRTETAEKGTGWGDVAKEYSASKDCRNAVTADPYGACPVPFSAGPDYDFQQRVAATIQDSARWLPESTLLLCLDYRAAEHPVRRRTDFLSDHRPHWA